MTQPSHIECEALIQPVQCGCKKAYAHLLRETVGILKSFLTKYLANNDEMQDVIQESLLSVHRALPSFNTDRPYRPWVLAIARHRLNDYFRVRYSRQVDKWVNLDELASVQDDANIQWELEREDWIESYLKELPEHQQTILYLMHHEGYTVKEISARLGMSEAAVKVNAHRAYEKVRQKMRMS